MRIEDWENTLNNYIFQHRKRGFKWGEFDCVRFTFGAVEAITGVNYLANLDWSNEQEARALLDEKSLDDRIAEHLESVPPAFAKRGDIGMYEGACGIVIGRNCLFIGETWRMIPITQLDKAFHV